MGFLSYLWNLDFKLKFNGVSALVGILAYMKLFNELGVVYAAVSMAAFAFTKMSLLSVYEYRQYKKLVNSDPAAADMYWKEWMGCLKLELLGLAYLIGIASSSHFLGLVNSNETGGGMDRNNIMLYLQPVIDSCAILIFVVGVSFMATKFLPKAKSISEQLGSSLVKYQGKMIELDAKVWKRLDYLIMIDSFVGLTMGLTAFTLFHEGTIGERTWFALSNVYTKISMITCSLLAIGTLVMGRREAINGVRFGLPEGAAAGSVASATPTGAENKGQGQAEPGCFFSYMFSCWAPRKPERPGVPYPSAP